MKFDNLARKLQEPKADQSDKRHKPSRLASFAKYALPALILLAPATAEAGRVRDHKTCPCPPIPEVQICTDHSDPSTCEPAICALHMGGGKNDTLTCEPEKKQDVAAQGKTEDTEPKQKTGSESAQGKTNVLATAFTILATAALVTILVASIVGYLRKKYNLPGSVER